MASKDSENVSSQDINFVKKKLNSISHSSDDEEKKKLADDCLDHLSEIEEIESKYINEEKGIDSRWKLFLTTNNLSEDDDIVCDKCGYKRYSHKEHGVENYKCPKCRIEYGLDDEEVTFKRDGDNNYKKFDLTHLDKPISVILMITLMVLPSHLLPAIQSGNQYRLLTTLTILFLCICIMFGYRWALIKFNQLNWLSSFMCMILPCVLFISVSVLVLFKA